MNTRLEVSSLQEFKGLTSIFSIQNCCVFQFPDYFILLFVFLLPSGSLKDPSLMGAPNFMTHD